MKLQKIGDIQPTLPFTEYDFLKKYRESFAVSELGRIRALLPLKEMADELASHFPKKHSRGNTPMFPPDGEVALMFLKPYTGLSDDGLIEMLNGSIHMQMFCGVLIDPSRPIKDGKIVSTIRNRLAPRLDIVRQQSVLYKKWDSMLKDKDLCMSDATCYESHLRYPTDIKLMWECCEWLHKLLQKTCREQGERLPRSKYNEVAKARLAYAKQRMPKKSATRRMQRRLLKLLGKLIGQWNCLCRLYAPVIHLSAEQDKRIMAIKEVHRQQTDHFNKKEVKHRIVSIDRPYIRPIVRGKENKRVEFGAKVNNIQVDGISFIEHHSFEAFNEGTRLKQCVEYQESLTGVKVTRIGMDTIYANNETVSIAPSMTSRPTSSAKVQQQSGYNVIVQCRHQRKNEKVASASAVAPLSPRRLECWLALTMCGKTRQPHGSVRFRGAASLFGIFNNLFALFNILVEQFSVFACNSFLCSKVF